MHAITVSNKVYQYALRRAAPSRICLSRRVFFGYFFSAHVWDVFEATVGLRHMVGVWEGLTRSARRAPECIYVTAGGAGCVFFHS